MNPPPKISPVSWLQFKKTIDQAHSILITTHIRSDGDAIGSQRALGLAFQALGKEVLMVNGQEVPPNLAFLDPEKQIFAKDSLTPQQQEMMSSVDLLVSVDTRAWAQLGPMREVFQASSAPKMVLDHHENGDDLNAEEYIDATAEAAGTIVFQAIKSLGLPLTRELATLLFVAIATDTGWFRFHSVTAETYRTIAELVDAGARPDEVYQIIYEQESWGRLRLIGRALAKTEKLLDGKGAFTFLSQEDFCQTQALPSDSEDIINMTLSVAGTELALIMVEQPTGGYKISFRSRCSLDCSQLAAQFGGGGHKAAAGAFLNLPFDEAKTQLLRALCAAYADRS